MLATAASRNGTAQEPSSGPESHAPAERELGAAVHEEAQDVAEGGAEHGEGKFDIVHHLGDSHELDFAPFGTIQLPRLEVFGIDMSITKHVVFLWLSAALMLALFIPMARNRGPVRRGVGNFLEAFVVYVRDEVAVNNIGKKDAGPYVPYLLTLFFFILFANLLGLLPFGATATSNWIVTGTLALITMVVAEGSSVVKLGAGGYARQFIPVKLESQGVVGKVGNVALGGLLFVIEAVSHVSRIIALMIRLAANMTAGHVVILALLGLIFILNTYVVAPISVAFAVGVYMLEIFIALVQAFIFTMLTALFIGMAVHPHH
ncbi:MAG: F0F1 ATP synthase subunit A [Gemmatimonadetes bacterium]|nr:F0F1 ATP synthase subunit A [Gemmatimonadota bacterium]